MRCKVGDLAVIVRSNWGLEGTIVRCVKFGGIDRGLPWWVVEPPVAWFKGVSDESLRPVRDQDGEDEMLRIAGNPIHEEIKRLNDKLTEALERIERVKEKTHG